MTAFPLRSLFLAPIALSVATCLPFSSVTRVTPTVEGVVHRDGQPLVNAIVVVIPQAQYGTKIEWQRGDSVATLTDSLGHYIVPAIYRHRWPRWLIGPKPRDVHWWMGIYLPRREPGGGISQGVASDELPATWYLSCNFPARGQASDVAHSCRSGSTPL